jgi:hypothetical protein
MKYADIIIIGSGMSGLYSAYKIKKESPNTTLFVLEKFKKTWIGGRTSNEMFYGTQIVTGAGIGRKDTNPLLIKLMKEFNIQYTEFKSVMDYSKLIKPIHIFTIIEKLRIEYKKHPELHHYTFKDFFIKMYGKELYDNFLISAGYTDYQYADIYETLYNYGMDDNQGGWNGLHIQWKKIVDKLYEYIGKQNFKFSSDVVKVEKVKNDPCLFEVITKDNKIYYSNKVIIATTITGIKTLLHKYNIYNQIHGQPFLRLYAKFDKKSTEIMKKYVKNYTIVPGPLQKIIPIDSNKGVYMIAYSDNENAVALKNNLKNIEENRILYSELIKKSLGILENENIHIISIKDFYWPIGTHYYQPLRNFNTRNDFVKKAQHPEEGILVVGEAVSRYQGWVEGALESVENVLTKTWITTFCK